MYGTGGAFRVPKSNTVESTASDAIARITITVLVQIAPLSAPSRAPRARTTAKARNTTDEIEQNQSTAGSAFGSPCQAISPRQRFTSTPGAKSPNAPGADRPKNG